jgi:hypothetical protein
VQQSETEETERNMKAIKENNKTHCTDDTTIDSMEKHTNERGMNKCRLLVNIIILYYLQNIYNIYLNILYVFSGIEPMNRCKIIVNYIIVQY